MKLSITNLIITITTILTTTTTAKITKTAARTAALTPHEFIQSVTHQPNDPDQFRQLYYENRQYSTKGGPAILYIGGEGAFHDKVMVVGEAYHITKRLNGTLFGLEHRYYGQSQPKPDWSTDNLKYLTSELAIKDIINFIKTKTEPNQKWVIIGGSYAGNLAAWSRQKYPNLIHAAVASSAPIRVIDDFYEFDSIVSRSLGPTCGKSIDRFVRHLDKIMDSRVPNEMENLKLKFGCSEVKDDIQFLSVLADSLATAVQYHRSNTSFNINTVCDELNHQPNLDHTKLMNHMINVTQAYLKSQDKSCRQATYIDELSSIKIDHNSGVRQWSYQTCTEFGYWQSSPSSPSTLRTRSFSLTSTWLYKTTCSPVNFSHLIGPPRPPYQPPNPHSHTLFLNGDLDPWSHLSILPNSPDLASAKSILIEGSSHTQDLSPNHPTDPPSLRKARRETISTLQSWLNA